MDWWYRLYGWSHLRPFAAVRILLLLTPVYWIGQLIPIYIGWSDTNLTFPQDVFAGFWVGITMVIIFASLLTIPASKYHELVERESKQGGN